MFDMHARTQAWMADLAVINAEIDRSGFPAPRKAKRSRKLKPLWEE
ncbi:MULTISPECIES: hypothetical protein [Sphingobium]|nr:MULTISPECIES: hypothetical protein [Sphingobium]NYI25032.1 hypothetical protein [Sphingobium indicum]